MTEERNDLSGDKRPAAAHERSDAEPDDRNATAGSPWDSDCGSGCGCFGDRPGRAAAGAASPAEASRPKGFIEPWRSMKAAMGGGSCVSGCFGVPDQMTDVPTADADESPADRGH